MSRRPLCEPTHGRRGSAGSEGWWIDLDDAKKRAFNAEWWTETCGDGKSVEAKQHDPWGPPDKPVWLFKNGDMYLGEWRISRKYSTDNRKSYPVEHGFGVTCMHETKVFYRGFVYVGEWQHGLFHGYGKRTWLQPSAVWKNDKLPRSPIHKLVSYTKKAYLPFIYEGKFDKGLMHDSSATVTLKDGTLRRGPWKEDSPCGDWWKDHELVAVVTAPSQRNQSSVRARRPATPVSIDSEEGYSTSDKARKRKASQSVDDDRKPAAKQPPVPRSITLQSTRKVHSNDKAAPPTNARDHNGSDGIRIKQEELEIIVIDDEWVHDVKQEEPEIIIIDDDSTHGVKQEEEEETVEESGSSKGIPSLVIKSDDSTVQEDEDCDEAVQRISFWLLKDVIGYDYSNDQETDKYARKMIAFGVHSVEMILDRLPRSIVDAEFTWMRPFHRFLLKQRLKD